MAHVPALATCALAGLAVGEAQRALALRGRGRLAAAGACLLLAAIGVGWQRRGHALAAAANDAPSLRLAFDVARLAQRELSAQGRLAVAAPPPPADALEAYLRKLERSGGDVVRARAVTAALPPPDLMRIRAQLARQPKAVIVAGQEPAELLAVFDDAPGAERFATGMPLARFVHGSRAVTVYRP
jgi:hypothetical protein